MVHLARAASLRAEGCPVCGSLGLLLSEDSADGEEGLWGPWKQQAPSPSLAAILCPPPTFLLWDEKKGNNSFSFRSDSGFSWDLCWLPKFPIVTSFVFLFQLKEYSQKAVEILRMQNHILTNHPNSNIYK